MLLSKEKTKEDYKKLCLKLEYQLYLKENEMKDYLKAYQICNVLLDNKNEIIYKAIEYLTSYESISIIQGLNNIEKNKHLDKKTMIIMTNRYLDVHDKLLNILKGDKIEKD